MLVAIDIILPCYNPNDTWHLELMKFHEFIKENYKVNFILVNDGSREKKIIRQIGILKENHVPVEFVSYDVNRGKGFALRRGVLTSGSDFVIYTDVDFPFTNNSMYDLINRLVKGTDDIVTGYRSGNYYTKKMTYFRKTLSRAFRYFIRHVLKMPVEDTQCGLKGFNDKGRKKFLATTINRYLFDFEFIYTSARDKNIKMSSIEVQLKDNVVFSKMRLGILFQESFNLLRVLIKN